MRILFEREVYGRDTLENLGLSSYAFYDRDNLEGMIPYVGYIYSRKVNDSIFILPKVFLFEGTGDKKKNEFAFGKYHKDEVLEISSKHNPLKKDGLDKVVFGLSTWIYQAIDKYSRRHKKNDIVKRSTIQGVNSHNGENDQTFIDTILALLRFHKEHANLFTYISIINSSGNNKIHWTKTISKVQPIIKDGNPYYLDFKNKNKTINFDEELIILFYSVLQYLKEAYLFPVKTNINYELIKPSIIGSMIQNGRGTRTLLKIRRKYFKDELVQLWKLLYTFFSQVETIRSSKYSEEALIASSFDRIFEDMVDCLVGDEEYAKLKANDDGKEIDHLYTEESFLEDKLIYYIGDSKYYSHGNDIDAKSIAKQFTYARNIIQANIDIFNKGGQNLTEDEEKVLNNMRYRDPITEGYNFSPNFFIRGYINAEDMKDGRADYGEERLVHNKQIMPVNTHFHNRPFDRDTLILKAYNINFLFVMASYITNTNNKQTKERIQKRFRTDLLEVYNNKFDFFRVRPKGFETITIDLLKAFIDKYFRQFHGNMYHAEGKDFIWFAFDKGSMTEEQLCTELDNSADITKCKLGSK